MPNSNDNLQITMTAGQKNEFKNFINLQLWASKGVFKISNKTFDFSNRIGVPSGATGGTLATFSYISSDGTTPSLHGSHTNAPGDILLSEVTNQVIEVECITDGVLTSIIES